MTHNGYFDHIPDVKIGNLSFNPEASLIEDRKIISMYLLPLAPISKKVNHQELGEDGPAVGEGLGRTRISISP